MILSSRDAILSADDLPRVQVPTPEWGGWVTIRTMTGSERDAFEAAHRGDPYKDLRARLAAATICHPETGDLLFTAADVPALGRKSAAALDRIFLASVELSKISKEAFDELEKNS